MSCSLMWRRRFCLVSHEFEIGTFDKCLVAESLSVVRLQEYHKIRRVTANLLNNWSVAADSIDDGRQ
jgi:hypothetical protein